MTATLTNENINIACEEAEAFITGRKVATKEMLRVKLSMEEVLLTYQKALGPDAEFILDTGSGLGRTKLRLTVPGAMLDPFMSSGSSDEDAFMRDTLIRMGQMPRWRYKRGRNEVLFTLEKARSPEWAHLLIALVAAIVCGLLIRLFPGNVQTLLLDGIISPLLQTFLGFLNAVAGPMVFLSVVWGIYSIGDTATFSVMGKRLGLKFGLYLFLMSLVTGLACIPIFSLNFGTAEGGGDFSSLYQMVLDIVPPNMFTPFSRGNTLQILFLAILAGISMLVIGKETQSVADLSEQLGLIVNGIMHFVSRLIPAFVFGSLFNIIASSALDIAATGGKFLFSALLGSALLLVLHTAAACLRCRMSPLELWKKTLSTFIISITTASSSAAFSDNLNSCIEKLGISKRLANFGVPFGQTLYKPGVAMLFLVSALSAADNHQIPASATWLVTAFIMCYILSVAAPPVPGGMTASFTILFTQLGLPAEDLAIILSLSAVLDFVITATNLFSGQCVLKIASMELDTPGDHL